MKGTTMYQNAIQAAKQNHKDLPNLGNRSDFSDYT